MFITFCTGQKSKQLGVALLFVVAVLLLGSATFFLGTRTINSSALARQSAITQDLQKAREALIAYALTYADNQVGRGPGRFPCPDHNSNGSPQGAACKHFKIGRLPINWDLAGTGKFQEIYPFAELAPRRFWYVVSPNFLSSKPRINTDTAAQLTVDNIANVVAVIIDPGEQLAGQSRTRNSNNPEDYLEGGNQDDDGSFFTSSAGQFNDRIIYITKDELMPFVEKRVLGFLRDWLNEYAAKNKRYPYPAALDDRANNTCTTAVNYGLLPKDYRDGVCLAAGDKKFTEPEAWFFENEWDDYIYYHADTRCLQNTPVCTNATELTVNSESGFGAMIASFGEQTSKQNRAAMPANLASYLDSAESQTGAIDGIYVFNNVDANNNDQVIGLGVPPP